jgi:hypothetical protein
MAAVTSAMRQVQADQLDRIDPDAHRALGAEQLRLAHARNALDLIDHVARQVIAERGRIEAAVGGRQADEHQEVERALVDLHALLRDGGRQARFNALHAVLHIDRRQIRIGARDKGDGDRDGAAGLALDDSMYCRPSAPFISCSMTLVTLVVQHLRRAPG